MCYVGEEGHMVKKKKKAKSHFSVFEFAMILIKELTFSKPPSVRK